jgi:hypothetical protein
MKIPQIKVHYYYKDGTPVFIRYGIGRDGYYFFEVITKMRHGASYLFTNKFDNKTKWDKYIKYLNTLDVETRIKKVKKVVKRIEKHLDGRDIPIGGIYKFKVKTLFVKL